MSAEYWLLNGPTAPTDIRPRGIVRTNGRQMLDDNGPKHFLSTTLMWSVYGYEHEHGRWLRNIRYAASNGCDGIRTLGSVMGNSWQPRVIDPTLPGYEPALAGQIDDRSIEDVERRRLVGFHGPQARLP